MRRSIKKGCMIAGLLFLTVGSSSACYAEEEKVRQQEEFLYEFSTNNIQYIGIYKGETFAGKPDGEGIFESGEESPYVFTYEGEFEEGVFWGNGKITYDNGEILSGKFKDGVPNGKMTLLHKDGTYSAARYTYGMPYGSEIRYSEDGEVLGKDFYYDGILLSDWKKDTEDIEYRELYENSKKNYGRLLKLDCTVLNVYENNLYCIFKIKDQEDHVYWGSYSNTAQLKYNQSVMPALEVGDELELYGFFTGITPYNCANDDTDYGYTFPEIVALTAEKKDVDLDLTKLSKEYEEILQYPYHYYHVYDDIKMDVEEVIYAGTVSYIKGIDDEGNHYYCQFEVKEDQTLPIAGDRIRVKGRYNGLYKEYNGEEPQKSAKSYVLIKSEKLKITKKR